MAFTIPKEKFGKTKGGGRFHSATATGTGVMDESLTTGLNCSVREIRLHLSAAGATAENFTGQHDAQEGVVFDLLIVSQDMNGETDFHRVYDGEGMVLDQNDLIDFDYANTDARTWGLEIIYKELR